MHSKTSLQTALFGPFLSRLLNPCHFILFCATPALHKVAVFLLCHPWKGLAQLNKLFLVNTVFCFTQVWLWQWWMAAINGAGPIYNIVVSGLKRPLYWQKSGSGFCLTLTEVYAEKVVVGQPSVWMLTNKAALLESLTRLNPGWWAPTNGLDSNNMRQLCITETSKAIK